MAATREDIRRWLEAGKKMGATHLIVVCDKFDWEDYPVYVDKTEDVRRIFEKYHGKNMQKVMEVYSFNRAIESQLDQHRSFNFD